MEVFRYQIPEKLVATIHSAIWDLAIPLEKQVVSLPPHILWTIRERLLGQPETEDLMRLIQTHLLYPYTNSQRGSGYLILDGLYPDKLYPNGISPVGFSSIDLAPLDENQRLSNVFRTELLETPLRAYIALASLIGRPFRMFDKKSLVSPISAHAAAHPKMFGGMGENLLHKDGGFLTPGLHKDNLQGGPGAEVAGLLAINPDRYGGGITWIFQEDVEEIMHLFSESELDTLKAPIFFYLQGHDLNDAAALQRFSILYQDSRGIWRLRFSGKLRPYMEEHWQMHYMGSVDKSPTEVFRLLDRIQEHIHHHKRKLEIFLKSGSIVFSNTLVTMHGRSRILDTERLLAHLFIRVPDAH